MSDKKKEKKLKDILEKILNRTDSKLGEWRKIK